MPVVKNARDAIKIAQEVIREAGYVVSKISSTELDEDEETWTVEAFSGQIEIHVEIDERTGEVLKFSTD